MDRTGIENQSELRAAVNAAVRANLSIYTLDIRGLQALVPGGEAQSASLRGTSAYSGRIHPECSELQFHHPGNAGHAGRRHRWPRFSRLQRFRQSVQGRPGRYLQLLHARLSQHQPRARRPLPQNHGAAQSARTTRWNTAVATTRPPTSSTPTDEDRERQLDEELASELPSTDLPVYLAAGIFPHWRTTNSSSLFRWSFPARKFPSPATARATKPRSISIGEALDDKKRPVGDMRDTVKLAVKTSAQVKQQERPV